MWLKGLAFILRTAPTQGTHGMQHEIAPKKHELNQYKILNNLGFSFSHLPILFWENRPEIRGIFILGLTKGKRTLLESLVHRSGIEISLWWGQNRP